MVGFVPVKGRMPSFNLGAAQMKKCCFVFSVSVLLFVGGCVNSSRYNESKDELWIQQQLESGESLPPELRGL